MNKSMLYMDVIKFGECKKEIEFWRSKAERYQHQYENYFQKCLKLNELQCEQKVQIEELECRLDVADNEIQALQQKLSAEKEKANEIVEGKTKVEEALVKLQQDMQSTIAENYVRTKRIFGSEIERLDDELHDSRDKVVAMEKQQADLEAEIRSLSDTNAQLKLESNNMKSVINKQQRGVLSFKKRFVQLYQQQVEAAGELQQLKAQKKSRFLKFSCHRGSSKVDLIPTIQERVDECISSLFDALAQCGYYAH